MTPSMVIPLLANQDLTPMLAITVFNFTGQFEHAHKGTIWRKSGLLRIMNDRLHFESNTIRLKDGV